MTDGPISKLRGFGAPCGLGLLFLGISYCLSYPAYVRHLIVTAPCSCIADLDGQTLPFYRPVDWLIDHTPIRRPMLAWAQFCGVGDDFTFESLEREYARDRMARRRLATLAHEDRTP